MMVQIAGATRSRQEGAGDLRRTARLFRRYMGRPWIYLAGVFLLVVEAVTAVVEPYPLAYLIDFLQGVRPSVMVAFGIPNVLASERLGTVLALTVAIIGIAAINSAADSLTEVCMARGGRSLGYSIRVAMYSHLQRLPLAYHDSKRTGDVLTRVTGDVLVIEDFIVQSISNILGSFLVLAGTFAVLLYQSWSAALIALIAVPTLALVSDHFSKRIKAASKTQRSREGELASTTQEMLTSIRLVQSYGRGTLDLARFADQTRQSMAASLSAANIQAQFSFVVAIAEAIAICGVIWLGVWLVDRNALTVGTLVLFVLLLQNVFKPARKIVSEWYKIGKVVASVERIDDLLGRDVGVQDLPGAHPAPRLQGRLTFRNVSFSYPAEHEDGSRKADRPSVLRNVDFEVSPGEVVALVGPSGAGKSTIAQLIPRLYDPDEGQVMVDGLPLRGLTLASLRSQVSLVLQETMLLSGSVAENIGYGIPNARQRDIEAAARQANAHEFIMALPQGYATELGERGSTLSGGQRQRISIARAFIRRAPILILDEPTTGLDADSAQVVVAALRGLMRGKTTILISHDPALIQTADRVLTLAEGRIVETSVPRSPVRTGEPHPELLSGALQRTSSGNGAESGTNGHRTMPMGRVGPRAEEASAGRSYLAEGLGRGLPGAALAMHPRYAADRVAALLLSDDLGVEGVTIEKMWLRSERMFTLRYRLQLGDGSERHILASVHRDESQAARYLERCVRPLLDGRHRDPWREQAGMAEDARLVVHPFPIDPSLPTLGRASDPAVVGRVARDRLALDSDPVVELVRYPRQGACVLRYDFSASDQASSARPGLSLYGKVYGGAAGLVVEGFLAALARARARDLPVPAATFPTPVLVEPSMRLLVTSEIPGQPLVRRLEAALGSGESRDARESLEPGFVASGRALAGLHQSDATTAPVHPVGAELADLDRQLRLVASIWPRLAAPLRRHANLLAEEVPSTGEVVLSHGDFTPSQVLIDDERCGVVDLDGLCWADPALDIGRFLAQLDLIVMKACGEGGRSIAADLGDSFLRGYQEASDGAGEPAGTWSRVAFYRRASLLRSALHACRQLKAPRIELAFSLLESYRSRSGRVEP